MRDFPRPSISHTLREKKLNKCLAQRHTCENHLSLLLNINIDSIYRKENMTKRKIHSGKTREAYIQSQAGGHFPKPFLTWKQLGQGEQRRIVGNVARREQQRGLLLVQTCQFFLQFFVVRRVSGDVTGTTGPNTMFVNSLSIKKIGYNNTPMNSSKVHYFDD